MVALIHHIKSRKLAEDRTGDLKNCFSKNSLKEGKLDKKTPEMSQEAGATSQEWGLRDEGSTPLKQLGTVTSEKHGSSLHCKGDLQPLGKQTDHEWSFLAAEHPNQN